ncbi:MAG: hypothetical protein KBG00_08020 [Rhodoferax sp.]|jgi:hypothetical protein|uniref:hypothetical protein n=1 Tax=Rhodoferax sp. TaxID=50421 RepID=UPI001B5BFFA5|nr:hypothetical protein [Rhodoferax sp.]MBP9148715.1 hypothetical protein [Rhodoferax sp.]MBP9736251.1 hypothetical protein [Rhodoferax sp.]
MTYIAPVPITHSSIAGNVPNTAGELSTGALAVNVADGSLYTKDYTGRVVRVEGDGGNSSMASASALDLSASMDAMVDVSGSTTITAISLRVGQTRTVRFTGALTITHNDFNLVLPGAANIVTVAGDVAVFRGFAGGVVRCTNYSFYAATAFPAGTSALPSITTRGDPDTGLYFPLPNTVGICTGGVERLRVNDSGHVAIAPEKRFYLDNGSDTYLVESAANVLDLYVGGVMALRMAITGSALAGHLTIEGVTSTGATGSGNLVFSNSPALTTPDLGTPSALVATNASGTAINLTAGNAQKLGGVAAGDLSVNFASSAHLAGAATYATSAASASYAPTNSHSHSGSVTVDGVSYSFTVS